MLFLIQVQTPKFLVNSPKIISQCTSAFACMLTTSSFLHYTPFGDGEGSHMGQGHGCLLHYSIASMTTQQEQQWPLGTTLALVG